MAFKQVICILQHDLHLSYIIFTGPRFLSTLGDVHETGASPSMWERTPFIQIILLSSKGL
jgi:hypothetical protein